MAQITCPYCYEYVVGEFNPHYKKCYRYKKYFEKIDKIAISLISAMVAKEKQK